MVTTNHSFVKKKKKYLQSTIKKACPYSHLPLQYVVSWLFQTICYTANISPLILTLLPTYQECWSLRSKRLSYKELRRDSKGASWNRRVGQVENKNLVRKVALHTFHKSLLITDLREDIWILRSPSAFNLLLFHSSNKWRKLKFNLTQIEL